MARKISLKQRATIRHGIRLGYSANRIQKQLTKQHIGLRRKRLLGQIRKLRHRPLKPHADRYYPRTRMKRRAEAVSYGRLIRRYPRKRIVLRGTWKGKKKTVEMTDSGNKLKDFVIREMSKVKRGEGWDARPQVISE